MENSFSGLSGASLSEEEPAAGLHLPLGLSAGDLQCPICVETISDAFVTSCGHTFCYTCLCTHLKHRRSCPSCSAYLTKDLIFPNFLLNKILCKAATLARSATAGAPLAECVQHVLSGEAERLRVSDIDNAIDVLQERRDRIEQQERTSNLQLLLLFLKESRRKKQAEQVELKEHLGLLQHDMDKAASTLGTAYEPPQQHTCKEEPAQQWQPRHHQQHQEPPPHTPEEPSTSHQTGGDEPSTSSTSKSRALPNIHFHTFTADGAVSSITLNPSEMTSAAAATGHLPALGAPPSGPGSRRSSSGGGTPGGVTAGAGANYPSDPHSTTANLVHALGPHLVAALKQQAEVHGGSSPSAHESPPTHVPTHSSRSHPPNHPPKSERSDCGYTSESTPTRMPEVHRSVSDTIRQMQHRRFHQQGPAAAATAAAASCRRTGPSAPSGTRAPTPPPAAEPDLKRQRIMNQFDELQDAYSKLRNEQCAGGDDAALGLFSDVLCSATLFSRMVVVAEVQSQPAATASTGGVAGRSAANIISSIELDKEDRLFATAGVVQRISIYDYHSLVKDQGAHSSGRPPVHHGAPVCDIQARSKLTCLSYSRQVQSLLAASDYEGCVTLWDTATSQAVSQYEAHEKRIWAVDFSTTDPQCFVSGGDDGMARVWSTQMSDSVMSLNVKANICSVRFNPWDSRILAIGSAAHTVLLYDLRSTRTPLCILAGHRKAVSYVRFLAQNQVVSASTDNSLRLWDVAAQPLLRGELGGSNKSNGSGHGIRNSNADRCMRSFSGHTNEKNFVGLAVGAPFIATGSETNEVFIYHKSISSPTLSHSFGGGATPNQPSAGNHFISSLCWRQSSEMLLSANSQGRICILAMQP